MLCIPLALNCSLALVSCDGYPDVCDQYNISTYPYVLLFHNSTLSPLPLTGTLDSAHLLSALGQHTPPYHHQHKTVVRGVFGNSVQTWRLSFLLVVTENLTLDALEISQSLFKSLIALWSSCYF